MLVTVLKVDNTEVKVDVSKEDTEVNRVVCVVVRMEVCVLVRIWVDVDVAACSVVVSEV